MSESTRPPPIPRPRSRARRSVRTFFLCLLLVFVGGLIWYVAGRARDYDKVQRLEAEVRKKGEPLTLKELAATYPPIPDDDNAAIVLLDLWEKDEPIFWQAFRKGIRPLPERSWQPYDPELPFLGKRKFSVGETLTPEARQAAVFFLKERAAHIDTVRSALKRRRCRFPIQIEDGFDTLLPHLQAIKNEAQTLRIAALIAGDGGDREQALSSLEQTIQIGDLVAAEPVSISQLVRVACLQMALSGAEDLLSRQRLSAEELARLRKVVESIESRKMLSRALAGERANMLRVFNGPEELWIQTAERNGEEDPVESGAKSRFGMKLLSAIGFTIGDRRSILEIMAQLITLAEDESPNAFQRAKTLDEELPEKLSGFPPKLFARLLLPAESRIIHRFVALEAHKRAALVALVTEQYRLEHGGALPDQLTAVASRFPSGLPKDPFDGETLRYRQLGTGYVVYAVGPDLRDDGGDKPAGRRSSYYLDETFRVLRAK